MLIGVGAVDLVPKKAAGTAAGFTGLFGYLGGATIAELGIGTVVQYTSWDGGIFVIIASCALAIFFLAFTWKAHDRRNIHDRARYRKGGNASMKKKIAALLAPLLAAAAVLAALLLPEVALPPALRKTRRGERHCPAAPSSRTAAPPRRAGGDGPGLPPRPGPRRRLPLKWTSSAPPTGSSLPSTTTPWSAPPASRRYFPAGGP